MKTKVRIAPSPTGYLHIGTARTALINWLYARKTGGEFILRIEDTDLERSKKEYEKDIIESLKWLGLDWDGEIIRQTERIDFYEANIKKLLDSGRAFWCHHTKEELENEQKAQAGKKEPPRHICNHKREELGRQKGEVIRLAVDENSTRIVRFEDGVRGLIEFEERLLGDFSLAKDLRVPLYNFAVVVDDIDMEITDVIRGEDHISNTPKQILIYEALGVPMPRFTHLPLILAPDRSKMSKRYGEVAVSAYKKDYLPEALVNFMAFLGYTYDKEILSKEEMAEQFDIKKMHHSGAVFNIEKLNWYNSQYVRKMPPEDFLKLTGIKAPLSAVPLITERLDKLSDVGQFEYLWREPEYEAELLKWKEYSFEDVKESLDEGLRLMESLPEALPGEAFQLSLDDLAKVLSEKRGLPKTDRGLVYWPLRVALTGRDRSPGPVEIAGVIGKETAVRRIKAAIAKLS